MLFTLSLLAQSPGGEITLSGTVLDKQASYPLEYATITLTDTSNPQSINGGITDFDGKFAIKTAPGVYDIKIEYISFKPVILKAQKLNLSPQQVASITKIMGVFAESRKTIQQSTGMTPEVKAEKLKKINDREDMNMKNILDDTQYAKFQELAKDIRKG